MKPHFNRAVTVLGVAALAITLLFSVFNSAAAAPGTGNDDFARVFVDYGQANQPGLLRALERAGGEQVYDFPSQQAFVYQLPAQALANLQANNPQAANLEIDPLRYPMGDVSVETMALFSDVTLNSGETLPYGLEAVQALDVWDADGDGAPDTGASTGGGKTVCIVDTGYYSAHEDFQGINAAGYSQIGGESWTEDGNGHGTHVAGTIAAQPNGVGVVGVAPGVDLYIIKFFNNDGSATFASDLIDAANRCTNAGADVISMSLGGGRSSGREERAFRDAYSSGVLSVAAAGNDGTSTMSYPASYDVVMSVAATDSDNNKADFSQFNSQVEIAAPGVSVLSTVPYVATNAFDANGVAYAAGSMDGAPNGTASGALVDGGTCESVGAWSGAVVMCERGNISFADKVVNAESGGAVAAVVYNNVAGGFAGTLGTIVTGIPSITMAQADGQDIVANRLGQTGTVTVDFTSPASGYEPFNGTSMATPHVSAVAALVWSAQPTATVTEIRDALNATALDLGAAGRDVEYGHGLVQALSAINYLGGDTGGGGGGNIAPTVSIDSPADGSNFLTTDSITFTGSASDSEDGDLSGSIAWSSDLDGSLGTGASITASLTAGTHTVTATVTDSAGATSTANIAVTVSDDSGGGGGGTGVNAAISTDASSYQNKDTVVITVTATDDSGAAISGAAVDISISTPKGRQYSGTATTDSTGQAVFNFGVNTGKDGSGTYNVSATVTANGGSATASTTFTAN